MGNSFRTHADLVKELEQMRRQVSEIEDCKLEFQKVQEKYERLLDSAPDALVFVNTDNKIVQVNAQFERLFGYDHGEIIGRELDVLIPERFAGRHRGYVEGFFREPRVRPMGSGIEIYARKKDGDEFPVDISLSLLQTDVELLVSAAIRDITKRREDEEQIKLNFMIQSTLNSMLKISLESVPLEAQFERVLDLILSIPHLSLQSRGAIYIIEEDPGILVMKAQRGFSGPDQLPCEKVPLGKCLCGQAAARSETVYSNHVNDSHEIGCKEDFPHGHYCVPILSGDRALGIINVYVKEGHKQSSGEESFLASVASTLAGIIQHNRTEYEKEHLQAQLAQAEKLAALGRFTANVAHEIRNPLTAIGGFARRLDKVIPEQSKEKEYANFIISEVARLEGILKSVLTFSREVAPHIEEYDIHEIIDRVLRIKEEICREKSISIHKAYSELPPILVDNAQLHEAVENLVLNAIDSMPHGGSLTVATNKEVHDGFPYVYVSVHDSGTGIPEEKMNLIFEPFYTTKIADKGTGLGLSITKKVVEDHGGFMKVQSEVGKGSVFTLYFPYKLRQ
ncbi:MAG: PAS domain S-box protein [Nitrospiraceae bacterium]|nr:MAG: PAS domain S-box protein [Nitrospiraceae bacterium]